MSHGRKTPSGLPSQSLVAESEAETTRDGQQCAPFSTTPSTSFYLDAYLLFMMYCSNIKCMFTHLFAIFICDHSNSAITGPAR